MLRTFLVTCVLFTLGAHAMAQAPSTSLPPDLAQLPDAIKTLQWKSIDLAAVQPLEYDRALLVMNHTLDELAPVRASEASLMSGYIDAQNLGAEFAGTPPPADATQLQYTDAVKISVAMLRGPLASSSFANELASSSPQALSSYKQMYEATCQRRWGEVVESLQQVHCMGAFIQSKGKMQDYQAWAKVEAQNRQLKYELEMTNKNIAAKQQQATHNANEAQAAAQIKLQDENLQLKQALAAAQAQEQQPAQASQQQQSNQTNQQSWLYAPYATGYGVPAYYGADAAWCHDNAYANASRAETEQRVSGWHGTPGVGGAGRAGVGRR